MHMTKTSDEELKRLFDAGEDKTPYMDMDTVRRSNQERLARRVSVDMPEGMLLALDEAAVRMGVPRQAVIKIWLAERLDLEAEREIARRSKAPAPYISPRL